MKELLIIIAKGLVEDPDAVNVTVDEPNEEGVTVYHLHVAQNDMGGVIGKQGRHCQGNAHGHACCSQPHFPEDRGGNRLRNHQNG